MLTGERRSGSGRRVMTVLGKIPAVPKPINLPSQRLENRGLDPNVEIVPRGSVSWGAAARSPPSTSPWANSTQSSSPPVGGGGPWGSGPPRPATASSSGPAAGSSGPPTSTNAGPWGTNVPRPSSAGSGARPSSAGNLRQPQSTLAAPTVWGPATARPSSASGVLGQASQPPVSRPRSAETRTLSTQAPALTRFADQTNGQAPQPPAWGGAGAARKLSEEPHQPARFTLTRVDFPTLGSEKNPDLRPQQNKTGSSPTDRTSVDERAPPTEELSPPGPTGPYEELPLPTTGAYGGQERMPDGWRRDVRPYGGPPGMPEGIWHRDGPPQMQPYVGGQVQVADTWCREPGHGAAPGGGPSDDNWRRGGPPGGPYGPQGPGRFQSDPAGFMHQQRYGPGPGPYGRGGGPGPGAYGRHGEMYGNAAPFGRPGGVAPPRPGMPMGPGMYQGPVPYDNYYGPPGPGYGSMDEREMMMLGMSGPPGMYGNFPQGPPVEPFGRYPHGGSGPGHRHNAPNAGINRERIDSIGYEGEGYREGGKYKDFKDGRGYDGGGFGKESGMYKEGSRLPGPYQDSGESRRMVNVMSNNLTNDMQRPCSRGGHHGSHRDWGAADSSDEPMDFSKPVFEEDVSSASPVPSSKQPAPSLPCVDSDTIDSERKPAERSIIRESLEGMGLPGCKLEELAVGGESKDLLVLHASKAKDVSKDDCVQTGKLKEVDCGASGLKGSNDDIGPFPLQPPKVNDGSKEDNVLTWKQKEVGLGGPVLKSKGEDVIARETKDPPLTKGLPLSVGPVSKSKTEDSNAQETKDQVSRKGLPLSSGSVMKSKGDDISSLETKDQHSRKALLLPNVSVSKCRGEDLSAPETKDHQASRKSVPLSIQKSKGEDSALETRDHPLRKVLPSLGGPVPKSKGEDINPMETKDQTVRKPLLLEIGESSDETKSRSKSLNNHDGEKEWRPKVSVLDTPGDVSRPSSAVVLKQATTPAVSVPSTTGVSEETTMEKQGSDLGSSTGSESYDYEAQRARMKEIAAQRAIQLRKEEEERIKEQKAKAFAKLEELNRRSLVVSVTEPDEEPGLSEATDETAIVNVQPEEMEVASAEVIVEEVHVVEENNSGTVVNTPRGGVRKGTPVTRKRKTKNIGRNNKQKLEGSTVATDSTSVVELNQGWNIDLSSSNDSGTEVGKSGPQAVVQSGGDDALKRVPSSVSQKESVVQESKHESPSGEQSSTLESIGSDVGSFRVNGDVLNKRPQRKSQPPRRIPARDRGTSQDVRVGDKPHGGEGMIWAPVRSPSGPHPGGPKGGSGSDGLTAGESAVEKKEEAVVPLQTGRARRAELERYTPKPVVKQQAQQQEEMLHQQAAPAVVQHQANDSSSVPVVTALPQNSSSLSEIKFGSEARQVDNSSKQGRTHASWRQRGSGSERSSASKDTHQGHPDSTDTSGKSQQPSYYSQTSHSYQRNRPHNSSSEQSRSGNSHQARADIGQPSRQQPSNLDKEHQNLEVMQQSRSSLSNVPAPTPPPVEKEQKITQESVTPYQPPRPGSTPKSRAVVEVDGQTSNEHVRPHRTNTSHVDGLSSNEHVRSHRTNNSHVDGQSSNEHVRSHRTSTLHVDGQSSNEHVRSHRSNTSHVDGQSSNEHVRPHRSNYSHVDGQSSNEYARPHRSNNSHVDGQNSNEHVRPHRSNNSHGDGQSSNEHVRPHRSNNSHVDGQSSNEHVRPHRTNTPHVDGQSSSEHVRPQRTNTSHGDRQHGPPGKSDRDHHGSHDRGVTHSQPRAHNFRHPAPAVSHERDHQRDVPNAVHHQQQQRGASDGHWQQTAGVTSERSHPNPDHGQSHEHSTKSTSHNKSQMSNTILVDRDHAPNLQGFNQHPKLDTQNKPHVSVPGESQKQSQYQPVSHQKPQHSGSQGSKPDNAHNSSHWNGEQGGSPPALRAAREHGHSRRGRFGGRFAGGLGRNVDIDRKEHPAKQRLSVDATGGAVPSQVGG